MKQYTYKEVYGTYGEIFYQFKWKTGISDDMILDWRPASSFYTDLGINIRRAIVIDLRDGGRIIYTPDKRFHVEG